MLRCYRLPLAKKGDPYGKKGLGFANADVAGSTPVPDSFWQLAIDHVFMSFSPEMGASRREFFSAAARYGLVTGLAAVAALTGAKRRLKGQRCLNQGLCKGCNVFISCGLPQALSAKLADPGGAREPLRQKS